MDKKPLTPVQRKVLWLMLHNDGPVNFPGGTRGFYSQKVTADHPGALIIYAYMEPELWLMRRGLIVIVPMNTSGRWYRLTEDGRQRAARIQFEPAASRRWTIN